MQDGANFVFTAQTRREVSEERCFIDQRLTVSTQTGDFRKMEILSSNCFVPGTETSHTRKVSKTQTTPRHETPIARRITRDSMISY